MNDNMRIYEKGRAVPSEAKKTIGGGRLKGMTDINPMWRIKTLTETFGVCGIGWKYKIIEKRLEKSTDESIAAFVDVELYVKESGEWSEGIPGTGGSMFLEKDRSGLYTNDECFKMALTDAISVACKSLGIGADVYWEKDTTKYTSKPNLGESPKTLVLICEDCKNEITPHGKHSADQIANGAMKRYGRKLCFDCRKKAAENEAETDNQDTE